MLIFKYSSYTAVVVIVLIFHYSSDNIMRNIDSSVIDTSIFLLAFLVGIFYTRMKRKTTKTPIQSKNNLNQEVRKEAREEVRIDG